MSRKKAECEFQQLYNFWLAGRLWAMPLWRHLLEVKQLGADRRESRKSLRRRDAASSEE
jgi:hypothetical protein